MNYDQSIELSLLGRRRKCVACSRTMSHGVVDEKAAKDIVDQFSLSLCLLKGDHPRCILGGFLRNDIGRRQRTVRPTDIYLFSLC